MSTDTAPNSVTAAAFYAQASDAAKTGLGYTMSLASAAIAGLFAYVTTTGFDATDLEKLGLALTASLFVASLFFNLARAFSAARSLHDKANGAKRWWHAVTWVSELSTYLCFLGAAVVALAVFCGRVSSAGSSSPAANADPASTPARAAAGCEGTSASASPAQPVNVTINGGNHTSEVVLSTPPSAPPRFAGALPSASATSCPSASEPKTPPSGPGVRTASN